MFFFLSLSLGSTRLTDPSVNNVAVMGEEESEGEDSGLERPRARLFCLGTEKTKKKNITLSTETKKSAHRLIHECLHITRRQSIIIIWLFIFFFSPHKCSYINITTTV